MEPSLLENSRSELQFVDTIKLAAVKPKHSYHPTRWPLVNRILDIVDEISGGRAGFCQKFFSFAFIGGCASVVNLAIYALLLYKIILPSLPFAIHDDIAYILAFEISVIANFASNDYFTFRHGPGRERTWLVRLVRFNITSISGGILTYLIHLGLIAIKVSPVVALAIAIVIVLFYNFAFHHLFTYRKVKVAAN